MIAKLSIFLLLIFLSYSGFAQKLSDAESRRINNNIIVSYHLETTSPCLISLYVSTDGGSSWTGPLKKVKGDVGNNILGGNNKIEWSVLEEFNDFIGDNIKFQVRVENNLEFATVKIGSQVWSTSNLNVSRYRNGDEIPEVQDIDAWSKLTTGAWCYYENKTENGDKYGKLYNWYAVNDLRGLAPEGYHIPSDAEWTILTDFLGKESWIGLKSRNGWQDSYNGDNKSGFSGLPGGLNYGHSFANIGYAGYWWSSVETKFYKASSFSLLGYRTESFVTRSNHSKRSGLSVRCIRD
jgi:uncharacterized protein (TIGR02145 family)